MILIKKINAKLKKMKKIIYLIGVFGIVFIACNKNNDIVVSADDAPDIEVSFNTNLVEQEGSEDFLKTTGDYDRPTDCPAYITGIEITADNQAYHLIPDIVETYPFEDVDDGVTESITMTVKAGINHFSAVTTTNVDTTFNGRTQYFVPRLDHTLPEYDELIERAEFYGKELLEDDPEGSVYEGFPLHAVYATEQDVSQEISFTTNNPVDLDLLPQNGRVNIIMECNEESRNFLGFGVWTTLYDANDQVLTTIDDYWNKIDPGIPGDTRDEPDPIALFGVHSIDTTAAVWYFNMDQMIDGTYVNVKVAKRAQTSNTADDWVYILDEDIDVEQGKNITYLIYFNGELPVTASFSATMTPFSNTYGTTDL